jgi:6-phosphogluconolactonase
VKGSGALVPLERVTMLPGDFTGKSYAADIHFSPDGKFLYASNRGHESLAIYGVNAKTGKLTVAGHAETHGKHPRNFLVDQKGEFVIATNRDNDNVVFFKRNSSTGQLTYTGKEISIPTPVCVKQLFLN